MKQWSRNSQFLRYFLFALLAVIMIGLQGRKLRPQEISQQTIPIITHSANFKQLPGWGKADVRLSLRAFNHSCDVFLQQKDNANVGSNYFPLKAKDWYPVCHAASKVNLKNPIEVKQFFESWFEPRLFSQGKPLRGLFTGYYLPTVPGSVTKTAKYRVPIYGVPDNLAVIHTGHKRKHQTLIRRKQGHKLFPYYTRHEINHGALQHHAPILAWVENEIDRLRIEIEGSGYIQLADGKLLKVGFAGVNGAKFVPIAKIVIQKGLMRKDEASLTHIRQFMVKHPALMSKLLEINKSFVFFRKLETEVVGGQGAPLTPQYSLAVDRKWLPMGVPVWVHLLDKNRNKIPVHQRLMVAQDVGGMIHGTVRADVFFGGGDQAYEAAEHLKSLGYYWVLLPKIGRHFTR